MVNRGTERPQRAPQAAAIDQRGSGTSKYHGKAVGNGIVQRLANSNGTAPSPASSTKNVQQQTGSPANSSKMDASGGFLWDTAVQQGRYEENGLSFPKPRQLRVMTAILLTSLVVANGLVSLVVQFGLSSSSVDFKATSTMYLSQDIQDTASTVVPFIEAWYQNNGGPDDPLLVSPADPTSDRLEMNFTQLQVPDESSLNTCMATVMQELVVAVPATDPDMVLAALEHLGLANVPALQATEVLGGYLEKPKPTRTMLRRSQKCLAESPSMPALICGMVRQYQVMHEQYQQDMEKEEKVGLFENPEWQTFLRDVLHYAVVYDGITTALVEKGNLSLLQTVTRILTTTQKTAAQKWLGMEATTGAYNPTTSAGGITKKQRTRQLHHLDHVLDELQRYTDTVSAPEHDQPLALLSEYQSRLQLSILQQSQQQIEQGYGSNARVGLALAASVTLQPSLKSDRHELSWKLGHEWVDAYLSWMFAVGMSGDSLHAHHPGAAVPHLWMPSVACAGLDSYEQGESWYARHTVAMALAAVALPGPLKMYENIPEGSPYYDKLFGTDEEQQIAQYARAMPLGRINQQTVRLVEPTESTMRDMFATLHFEEEGPRSSLYPLTTPWKFNDEDHSAYLDLDETDFALYVGFLLIGTTLLAGLGLELVVWSVYIAPRAFSWSDGALETTWKLVQLVLPLLAATAVGLTIVQHSIAALPLLVVALYKLGYPETWLNIRGALLCRNGWFQRSADLIHGMAGTAHHSAAIWIICFLLTGVLPMTRALVHPLLTVLVQYAWCVMVRSCQRGVYIVGALALEGVLEWMIFSGLSELHASHWTASHGALVLLVSHWMYLIGGLLELVHDLFVADSPSDAAEQQAMMSSFILSEKVELAMGERVATLVAIPENGPGSSNRQGMTKDMPLDNTSFAKAKELMRDRSTRTLSSIEEGTQLSAPLPCVDDELTKRLFELDMKSTFRSIEEDEMKSMTTC